MQAQSKVAARYVGFALALLALVQPVYAVDGVIEINAAKVVANGGFPFVISQPGSYRLTGDLSVDQNTTAIQITANNVTLDLNGFAIIGPTVCSGTPPITPLTCTPAGSGVGISADQSTTSSTVMNGTVRGMGGAALVVGGFARVEGVRLVSNGGAGISGSFSSTLSGNMVISNGGAGIALGSGCTVTGNTVNNNKGTGISTQTGSTLLGNTVRGNGSTVDFGLNLVDSGYGSNVVSGTKTVSGGVQIGTNLCNSSTTCP